MGSDQRVNQLKQLADDKLLSALGLDAYMEACALMRELEELCEHLNAQREAEALSYFTSLLTLRYAGRRRHA